MDLDRDLYIRTFPLELLPHRGFGDQLVEETSRNVFSKSHRLRKDRIPFTAAPVVEIRIWKTSPPCSMQPRIRPRKIPALSPHRRADSRPDDRCCDASSRRGSVQALREREIADASPILETSTLNCSDVARSDAEDDAARDAREPRKFPAEDAFDLDSKGQLMTTSMNAIARPMAIRHAIIDLAPAAGTESTEGVGLRLWRRSGN
jgi:hypothetical protein